MPSQLHTALSTLYPRVPAASGNSGQSADMWSGLPQEKHVDFFLVASAESHVATRSGSGSVLDQHAWGLEANFSLNCVSYCCPAA